MVWNFSCKLAFCTLCHSCYLWFHFVKVGPSCVGLRLKSNLHMHFIDFSTIWSNVSTEAVRNNSNLNSVLTPISLRSLVRSSLSCFLLLQNVNKDYYLQKKTCASLVADLVPESAQDLVEVLSLGFYIPSTSSKFWHIIWSPTRICSWGAWRVVNSEPFLLQSKFFLLQPVTSQVPNNCSTNKTRFLQFFENCKTFSAHQPAWGDPPQGPSPSWPASPLAALNKTKWAT